MQYQMRIWITSVSMLLMPGLTVAQNSYNRWEASKPEPVTKPVPIKPAVAPAPKDTATMQRLTTTDGKVILVECMPVFPGGQPAMNSYFQKKVKRPAGPRQHGTVRVTFTVLTTGAVSGAHVKAGNGLNPAYDAALIDAINRLPPIFQPGGCNGNAKATEITIPYTF